jgi:hypothetical protein
VQVGAPSVVAVVFCQSNNNTDLNPAVTYIPRVVLSDPVVEIELCLKPIYLSDL